MIYALCEMVDDAETVMEFRDQEAAQQAFRNLCGARAKRAAGIVSMWLFRTSEDAKAAAIVANAWEIEVDESRCIRVLEWERQYGIHVFTSRQPEV